MGLQLLISFKPSWIYISKPKASFSINVFINFHPLISYSSATRVGTPNYNHVYPNIFQSTSNFNESVSICKKSGFFIQFFFRDIVDLKILQSDWPCAFWPISQESKFFQIWDLSKDTATNINFHCRSNWEKISKEPISRKFRDRTTERPYLWPWLGVY